MTDQDQITERTADAIRAAGYKLVKHMQDYFALPPEARRLRGYRYCVREIIEALEKSPAAQDALVEQFADRDDLEISLAYARKYLEKTES